MEMAKETLHANKELIKSKRNVVGSGLGYKSLDGETVPSIVVFVKKKYEFVPQSDMIPKTINGYITDVVEVGDIIKQSYTTKVRPIKPGYSCGHGDVTVGTIGGIFKDADNDYVILSNCHVLANEGRASIGDVIYQPGAADDPTETSNIIGILKDFEKIHQFDNQHDSAIAKLSEEILRNNHIDIRYPHIEKPLSGFIQSSVGMEVQKFGRTTGYTKSKIIAHHANFTVGYDFGEAEFEDCIVCENMSSGGDSGSIIMDNNNQAVALLFAGSDRVTLGHPIMKVVDRYKLQLLS